jgi:hypothetical protein
MRTLRLQRAAVTLACALALTCIAGSAFAAPEKEGKVNLSQTLKRTLLLFPVDATPTGATIPNAADVSMDITDVAASRLAASGQYMVSRFSRALPPVARLVNDQTLAEADVQPPFAEDKRKPTKVGKLAQYEVIFVGSVDDYQYNQQDNEVSMVVSGSLIETETGKVIKGVTVNAAGSKGGTAKEDEKAQEVARAVGEKLMSQLLPGTAAVVEPTTQPTKPQPEKKPKRRGSMDWLWGVLAVGLGLSIGLASGGGHGGGAGGSDNPPAPPRP